MSLADIQLPRHERKTSDNDSQSTEEQLTPPWASDKRKHSGSDCESDSQKTEEQLTPPLQRRRSSQRLITNGTDSASHIHRRLVSCLKGKSPRKVRKLNFRWAEDVKNPSQAYPEEHLRTSSARKIKHTLKIPPALCRIRKAALQDTRVQPAHRALWEQIEDIIWHKKFDDIPGFLKKHHINANDYAVLADNHAPDLFYCALNQSTEGFYDYIYQHLPRTSAQRAFRENDYETFRTFLITHSNVNWVGQRIPSLKMSKLRFIVQLDHEGFVLFMDRYRAHFQSLTEAYKNVLRKLNTINANNLFKFVSKNQKQFPWLQAVYDESLQQNNQHLTPQSRTTHRP